MSVTQQQGFLDPSTVSVRIRLAISDIFDRREMPSASEFLKIVESAVGIESRWQLVKVVKQLEHDTDFTRSQNEYLESLLVDGKLAIALRGEDAPEKEIVSSIDVLFAKSRQYRDSRAFQEMIDFMGRFRDYAPYNNMLVRIQNPSCSFYATASDWQSRFDRSIIEDARPMLILAPMHPVMLVYDVDQTEGQPLPAELLQFSEFHGDWDQRWLDRMVANCACYKIRVDFRKLSLTNSGFATLARGDKNWKMRIAIHDVLDGPSRFGVLCHELAHILLGHLGSDYDHWWPSRTNLEHSTIETEAEAVAWIVSTRFGLAGASPAYVSRHMRDGKTPRGVSPDWIAKIAKLVERMAKEKLNDQKPRKPKKS